MRLSELPKQGASEFSVCYAPLFFFLSSHVLSPPFFSLSLLIVTEIRGHITGFTSPLPTTVHSLFFFARRPQPFLLLVNSRLIDCACVPSILGTRLKNICCRKTQQWQWSPLRAYPAILGAGSGAAPPPHSRCCCFSVSRLPRGCCSLGQRHRKPCAPPRPDILHQPPARTEYGWWWWWCSGFGSVCAVPSTWRGSGGIKLAMETEEMIWHKSWN